MDGQCVELDGGWFSIWNGWVLHPSCDFIISILILVMFNLSWVVSGVQVSNPIGCGCEEPIWHFMLCLWQLPLWFLIRGCLGGKIVSVVW